MKTKMTKYFLASLVLLISYPSIARSEITYDTTSRSVSNWRVEAELHLSVSSETLTIHRHKRCIKLNNYWCLKDVGWNGGIGKDRDSHTAFINRYFASRAAVRNFRTAYIKHNRKSALSIMSVYAPETDCIGSNAARRANGTCVHGNNNTRKYAKAVASGITDDINADLKLFDQNNAATPALSIFLGNISAFEIGGLRVSKETIERGICMENSTCPWNH